jgi:hypothetical protein
MPRTHYTEIETQIQKLQKEIDVLEHAPHGGTGLTPQQAAQLHTAYKTSISLAPLLSLAPFSEEFLRNLRKLKTCEPMCVGAQLPLPDIIDVLVADLVLKEGI